MKSQNIVVLGYGLIGKQLCARVRSQGWHITHIVRLKEVCSDSGEVLFQRNQETATHELIPEGTSLVFLCVPSSGTGEEASRIMKYCISKEIPVVTSEKAALSYHFAELQPHLAHIGFSAAVGGGTRILPFLRDRMYQREDCTLHMVLNGTLNYVFDQVAKGGTLPAACDQAIKLGYAEPGAFDTRSIIDGELHDIVLKTCILYNMLHEGRQVITPASLSLKSISERELTILTIEASDRRFIISFSPGQQHEEATIGGFSFAGPDVHISAGFKQVDSEQFVGMLPIGAENMILSIEGKDGEDGTYSLYGPGAGALPTTAAMMTDAKHLLSTQTI